VELRPPTAAVDLQLRPVPCGVPTPRHLQLRPEAAPTPPRWTPNPGASRAPAVAARHAPRAHLSSSSFGRRGRPSRHLHLRPEPPTSAPPHHSSPGPGGHMSSAASRAQHRRTRARPSSCQQGRDSLASIAHLEQRYNIAHFFSLFPFGCVLDCARNGSGAVMWKRSESL